MRSKDILTIPNFLSFFRIFFVIPIYYFLARNENLTAVGFILIAILSDWLDGYIARRTNRITTLGKVLDPLADKINTAGGFIALALYQGFPLWMAAIIVLRDAAIVLGSVIIYRRRSVVSSSNIPGKITVFLITLFGLSYIFRLEILQLPLLVLVLIMIIYSIINYARVLNRKNSE